MGDYEFNYPKGITIYRQFGMVFISEKSGAQYYWVGTDIKDARIIKNNSGYIVKYTLTEPAFVSYFLEDEKGKNLIDKKGLVTHFMSFSSK